MNNPTLNTTIDVAHEFTGDIGMTESTDVQTNWQIHLNNIKEDIKKCQGSSESSYLEIGKLLIQARIIHKGHGNWINWLKKNVDFSVRHAQRLMRVAELFDDATLVSHLGSDFSKAYILTRLKSKDEIMSFAENLFNVDGQTKSKRIADMSRRELEKAICQHLKSNRNQPNTSSSSKRIDIENNTASSNAADNFNKHFRSAQESIDQLVQIIGRQEDSSMRESFTHELHLLWEETMSRLPEDDTDSPQTADCSVAAQ